MQFCNYRRKSNICEPNSCGIESNSVEKPYSECRPLLNEIRTTQSVRFVPKTSNVLVLVN
ncbi:hypothetical protein PHET_09576 [Paragonimus heterotremus]|uniref:Uncharacterized protein n=1 Tax=Paragonimus heterotremus TaxID=100268 RepID=A0A8J4SKW8_9TREM|nr:hypothetical protein PHET_09576 [Paragonimus heterotremus]